jgi:type VI secretion system secreted protein VgrG
MGVPVVLIGGKPAATLGATTAHGGTIVAGFPTVMIGEGAAAEIQAMLEGKVPQEVIDMVLLSPTLTNQLRDLQDAGWTVEMGVPGEGTFASRDEHRIVIDPNGDSTPEGMTQSLAHEAGHAAYDLPPEIPPDGLTREEYVRQNTDRNLQDEGAATLNNIQVRDEISGNGGPDIGIAGNPDNGPAYEAAYQEYQQTGDAAAARESIGNTFGHGERPSTAPEMDYDEYYRRQYEDRYTP